MPIEIQCPGCKKKLRVPEKLAGRSSQCPSCGATIDILASGAQSAGGKAAAGPAPVPVGSPASEAIAPPPDAASSGGDMWHMKTTEGDVYGPVAKTELDTWVAEDRIDRHCHLRPQSSDEWQPAAEVYPELAAGQSEAPAENPFVGIGQQPRPIDENPFVGVETDPSSVNPFASPSAAGGYASEGDEQYLTDGIRRAMRTTRPWVLFLSILGFIGTALMALFSLVMIGISVFGGAGPGFPIWFGLIYLVVAILYFLPSYFLFIYGSRIGTFLRTGGGQPLEAAITAQATYWKVMGMLVLVVIVLYIGMFVVLILTGAFRAMAG